VIEQEQVLHGLGLPAGGLDYGAAGGREIVERA
jgi:hypothetical protein